MKLFFGNLFSFFQNINYKLLLIGIVVFFLFLVFGFFFRIGRGDSKLDQFVSYAFFLICIIGLCIIFIALFGRASGSSSAISSPDPIVTNSDEHLIVITKQNITLDGNTLNSIEDLIVQADKNLDKYSWRIIDYYADYKLYNEVLEALNSLGITPIEQMIPEGIK